MSDDCEYCEESFGWFFNRRNYCDWCEGEVCSTCISEVPDLWWRVHAPADGEAAESWHGHEVCGECWDEHVVKEQARYEKAQKKASGVEAFSRAYRGRIPMKDGSEALRLKTRWLDDRDDAEEELRVLAALNGHNMVYKMKVKGEKRSDGNYIYRVWRASGVPALRIKRRGRENR